MSEEECLILTDWANKLLPKMKQLTNNRYNYTLFQSDTSVIPLVWEIRDRIIKKEGLESYIQEPILKDFLAILPPGSFIHKHRDSNHLGLLHTRFNVFLQVPDLGGITYYDDKVVDAKAGSYVISRSGIDEHWSTPIEGTESRISISYGWILPSEKLDSLTSDISLGKYRLYPLTYNGVLKNSSS